MGNRITPDRMGVIILQAISNISEKYTKKFGFEKATKMAFKELDMTEEEYNQVMELLNENI